MKGTLVHIDTPNITSKRMAPAKSEAAIFVITWAGRGQQGQQGLGFRGGLWDLTFEGGKLVSHLWKVSYRVSLRWSHSSLQWRQTGGVATGTTRLMNCLAIDTNPTTLMKVLPLSI